MCCHRNFGIPRPRAPAPEIIPTRGFVALLVITMLFLASLRAAGVTLERVAAPGPIAGALVR